MEEAYLFANRKSEIIKASLVEITPKDKKIKCNYRKAENKFDACGNCKHCVTSMSNTRYYYKCGLIGDSHSEATDIRVSYVCDLLDKE